MNHPTSKTWRQYFNLDTAIVMAVVAFVAIAHSNAFEDRLYLIVYYLTSVTAAYALVRRKAIGLAAAVVTLIGATMFAQLYYSARPDNWNPLFDAARDMLGLGALMYLTIRLLLASYQLQKTEKQRELKQRVETQLIAMRAEALRRTSHEVRTPLSTITAISETLLDGSTGKLSDDQREFVADIDEAAHHLLDLVNDILDYAKAEAGMIRIAPEPVALLELVDQCVHMISPRAAQANVNVTAQVAPELHEITADPLRLRQILLNLLSNAIKYNNAGGSVIVRVRPDGDQHLRISVRDTGRGIAAEHVQHLFEPYYQAAIADQGIGTGLGLAIIRHLSQLHGGDVEVESVVGAGTMFTVRLPRVAVAPEQETEPATSPSLASPVLTLETV